jgi:hypothetical protein
MDDRDLQQEIADLRAARRTTLTGAQFLVLLLYGPLVLAFVVLGVLIVWKTLNRPSEIAPFLDIVLVAFAIFSAPVTAGASQIMGAMADEIKSRKKGGDED